MLVTKTIITMLRKQKASPLRSIILMGLMFIFTQQLYAQIGEYRSELAIGGGGGFVLSQVGFTPEVPQTQYEGLMAGFTVRYTSEKYFSSICSVVGEMNLAKVGWREDIQTPDDQPVINSVTGMPERYERNLYYLQVPVFARLGWGRERRGFQAFAQAGPQVGVFLGESTSATYDFSARNITSRTSKIVEQETMAIERKFEYGIAGGAGIEYSHSRLGHFIIEGRYYYGLGDIYGNSKRDYFGRSNLTNIVIKFTYLFDLKKTNNPQIK